MTYEEFVSLRLRPLLRYAVMLTGDPHTAQDLLQETMIRVQVNWRRVAAADLPERYVQRMLTNAFIDLRRGSWVRRVVLRAEPLERITTQADHSQVSADREQVWSWLERLPRRQQAVLVLRYYEGLADAEIAEVLGCTPGTVRGYASRALGSLRSQVAAAGSRSAA